METKKKALLALAFVMTLGQSVPVNAQQVNRVTPPSTGWRKFGDPQQTAEAPPPPEYNDQQPQDSQQLPPGQYPQRQQYPPQQYPPQQQFGQSVTLPAGTWITIRVNQPLSSEYNQSGDAFTGTLERPLVANGLVVARRGQTIGGRVEIAEKGGRVKGLSRLGIEVTEVALVDGHQIPVRTQLIERTGNSSVGRDVAGVGAAAGIGAAIGAAADGGFGAGMGAIAGAAAGTIGVLSTRGNQTAVFPETMLTFRLMEPVTLPADPSFQPVTQDAYESRMTYREPAPRRVAPPAPVYYGYGYPYYAPYPYYYGPSFFFYSGPRYYGRGGYYYRGYRR